MHDQQRYPQISVVIPAYNEADNLQHVLPYIPADVTEVILVDGRSTDATVAVALQLRPDIRLVSQLGKGKGDALRAGFAACRGDIIVMLDADGSTDPGEIPQFVAALVAGYDYAKGSRFIKGGGSHDITPVRRCGNFFLSRIVNVIYVTRFSDLCYGYNAFWKHCLEHITIDSDGFEIETQINLQMLKAKRKIIEIPSFEHPRVYGKSNLQPWRDGWRVLRTIMRERRRKHQQTRHHVAPPPLLPVAALGSADPIAVIICTFAAERWDMLVKAVRSVQQQAVPHEIIVVVDHEPDLLLQVGEQLPEVIVVDNTGQRGLSDARNCGIAATNSSIIAFLDDDAVASHDWLARLTEAYSNAAVLATGGSITPVWQGDRPAWLPEEFYWVIGCTYRGLPTAAQEVRNPIGANMSFRRVVFETAGGFRSNIGRIGSRPLGGEETEMSIRACTHWPHGAVIYQPLAHVAHHVPPARTRWRYFMARCYAEGLSKAAIARFVGAGKGLAAESNYTLRTLPQGVSRHLRDALSHRSLAALARAGAIIIGLICTVVGYLVGRLFARRAAPQPLFIPPKVRHPVETPVSVQAH